METGQEKSIFGPYEDLNMLSWMRSVALDPCHSSPQNLHKMSKQVLNMRKFLILSSTEGPQRKRKLDHFLKGKSPSSGSRNQHRISEIKTSNPLPSFGVSVSCVIDSDEIHENVRQTPESSGSSPTCKEALDRNPELSCVLNTHDMDVPVLDRNLEPSCVLHTHDVHVPALDRNLEPSCVPHTHDVDVPTLDRNLEPSCVPHTHDVDVPTLDRNLEPSSVLHTHDVDVPAVDRSLELSCVLNTHDMDVPDSDITPFMRSCESAVSPKFLVPTVEYHEPIHDSGATDIADKLINNDEYLKRPQRITRSKNFTGDHVPTIVVPLGPRFQADIPEWTGPLERPTTHYGANDSETLKWLGVRIWPIKGRNSESKHKQVVGKGRVDSCSCASPKSVDCIKRHVLEERRALKANLGSAFYSWKFEDMGEDAAKSWPALDQEKFKGLIKAVATADGNGSFWKNVSKFFPSKRRESIISYYFNVYIPRSITMSPQWLLDKGDAQVGETADAAKNYMQEKSKCRKSKRR